MKSRVMGFSGSLPAQPVVFLHEDSERRPLVNGKALKITILEPGQKKSGDDFFVIRASGFGEVGPGDFVSFSEGVILRMDPAIHDGSMFVVRPGFISVSSTLEVWSSIQAGVLTVSDKGSRAERIDTSGPALEAALMGIGASTLMREIVPDDAEKISGILGDWISSGKVSLVLVTGGTGLSPRDVTPEALLSLGGKIVPGLGEFMRWKTSFLNERSILSRAFAVACEKTLVISLPGSEKGAIECFSSISSVLRHALEILSGKGTNCGSSH